MKSGNTLFAICALGMSGCATPVASIDYYDVDTATLKRIKPMTVIDERTLALQIDELVNG